MAEVWRGVHVSGRVPVAVKILTGERARETTFRERFRNEVRATARLLHPGIVMVLDHGELGEDAEVLSQARLPAGSPFLVMELAQGGSLAQAPLATSWHELKHRVLELLEALGHAHARGVIHRDITPNNVLLSGSKPRLKLTDFGIAQAFDAIEMGPRETMTQGTPAYMAPEQIAGQWRDQGPWTDLYALGCLIHFLAAGHPPFVGDDAFALMRSHLYAPPPRLECALPVPERFHDWLEILLAKDHHQRFQCAADAAVALRELVLPRAVAHRKTPTATPRLPSLQSLTRDFPSPTEDDIARIAQRISASVVNDDAPAPQAASWPRPSPPEHWRDLERKPRSEHLHLRGAGLSLFGLRPIPLVGRDSERDTLWTAMQEVLKGEVRVVLLEGAPGVGKSRLARWMSEAVLERGLMQIMRAPHNPVSPHGLAKMFARHFRVVGLERDRAEMRVHRALAQLGLTSEEHVDAFTDLMIGSAQTDSPTQSARAHHLAQPDERHLLVFRVLQRMAAQRPVCLWLDDVHWGADTLELVRYCVDSPEPPPLLFLLTVRSDLLHERPQEAELLDELRAHPLVTRQVIGPLEPAAQRKLTQTMLGLGSRLARQVDERSGGNPLFAVQLVGDWITRGVLTASPQTGFSIAPGCDLSLPRNIQQLWERRIARIVESVSERDAHTPSTIEALELASVLGIEIDLSEWEHACRLAGCPPHDDLVDALCTHGLATPLDGGWAFAHEMLRETLEASARTHGRLPQHHLACATMLRERTAHPTPTKHAQRGHHLIGAGCLEEAALELLHAARGFMQRTEHERCFSLLRKQREVLERAGLPKDHPAWLDGWTVEAFAACAQGEIEQATTRLDQVNTALARVPPDAQLEQRAFAAYVRGQLAKMMRDTDAGDEALSRAMRYYHALEDRKGVADCLVGLGVVLRRRGDAVGSLELFERALELYDALDDAGGTGRCLNALGASLHTLGRFDEAARALKQAFSCHVEVGNRTGQAECLNNLGEEARLLGDFKQARDYYERALDLLEEVGSGETGLYRLNLALVLMAQRDFEAAEAIFTEVLGLFERQGRTGLISEIYANLLPCDAARHDWDAWTEHLGRALALEPAEDFVSEDVAWTAELAAELTREQGLPQYTREALELARRHWKRLHREDKIRHIDALLSVNVLGAPLS